MRPIGRFAPEPSPEGDAYGLLLALLALPGGGGPAHRAAFARAAVSGWSGPWAPVLAEAEHHGVTPLVARVLAEPALGGSAVPEAAVRAFAALAVRHRAAATARERALDGLLSAFAGAGVRLLLLKGAALGHALYGDPGLRPMADLDLLVARRDLGRAVGLVERAGFAFDGAYGSRFASDMHHLPAARSTRSGFPLSLDLHVDALSPDQPARMTVDGLTEPPRPVARGAGPPGLTLGHADMLRHLCRHAFEPATRIRLVHLNDIWRYGLRFGGEIEGRALAARFPDVVVAHRLVADLFERDRTGAAAPLARGEGRGMTPMAETAASGLSPVGKLRALLDPPEWWLRGFYGVEPGRSLAVCRGLRHPATVAGWIGRRLLRRGAAAWPAGVPLSPSVRRPSADIARLRNDRS